MNKEQSLKKVADEHKIPEADVKEIYEEKLEESKEAGHKGEKAEKRALKRTFIVFKQQSMDSTEGLEGIFLGAGDRYDAVGGSRSDAIDAYKENPAGAIREKKIGLAVPPGEESNIVGEGVSKLGERDGWAIVANPELEQFFSYNFAERGSGEMDDANTEVEDGWRVYPLDQRKTYSSGSENDNYGMPQDKHSWTRRCVGVFIREDSDEAMKAQVTLRDEQSAVNPPLGEPVQFKARVNESDDEDLLYVNSDDDTEFNPAPDLEDKLPSIDTLIEKYYPEGQWRFDLDGLYEHLQSTSGRITAIVKGDVVDMDLEPTSNNTLRMVINQLSFQGGEMIEREATCWIPAWQEQYIDFAVESTVYVVGRARLQDAYDPSTEERSSDEKEAVINVQGIYADPTAKIPRETDTQDIEEDDVEFEEDEVEFDAEGEW